MKPLLVLCVVCTLVVLCVSMTAEQKLKNCNDVRAAYSSKGFNVNDVPNKGVNAMESSLLEQFTPPSFSFIATFLTGPPRPAHRELRSWETHGNKEGLSEKERGDLTDRKELRESGEVTSCTVTHRRTVIQACTHSLLLIEHHPAVRSVAKGAAGSDPKTAGVECEPPRLTRQGSALSLKSLRRAATSGGGGSAVYDESPEAHAVRESGEGLAWVFGLKPHRWVLARRASAMSASLPTAPAGVQFRKTQQVYQNLCCPFGALSFQKPDLVPDLILPGGLRRAPSCLNI
ncbi:hypothetical protein JOQ06_023305, partial [Pogonophryne albipinna]